MLSIYDVILVEVALEGHCVTGMLSEHQQTRGRVAAGTPYLTSDGASPVSWQTSHARMSELARNRVVWRPWNIELCPPGMWSDMSHCED